MSYEAVTIEHEGYSEMYDYYYEINGVVHGISENVYHKLAGLLCHISLQPVAPGSELSITIPEEKNGHPVSMVSISTSLIGSLSPGKIYPTLKHLYISANVRHLNVNNQGYDEQSVNLLNYCTVEISPDNPYFCVYENGIYSKDMTTLYFIFSPQEHCGGRFEVPSGVKRIEAHAASALKGLRHLMIREELDEIAQCAFTYCTDLISADIRAVWLGDNAFAGCEALTSLRLDCRVINSEVFSKCEKLKKIMLIDPEARASSAFTGSIMSKYIISVYVRDGILFGSPKAIPAYYGSQLLVRSFETDELMFELIIIGSLGKVFTEQGIDHKAYDIDLKEESQSKQNIYYMGIIMRAMLMRIRCSYDPFRCDEETAEFYKSYISEHGGAILSEMIEKSSTSTTVNYIEELLYLDLIGEEDMLKLIDLSSRNGRTEITALLMQKLNERKSHDQGI